MTISCPFLHWQLGQVTAQIQFICWRDTFYHTFSVLANPIPRPPIKQQICEQQNRINILEAPHKPGAPGSPLSVSLGRLITPQLGWHTGVWRSCCSSWSRSKPQFLREEHTAWPVNTSIQSALSLAGTSVHNNRTLSPKLLSYTRVAKSNTWNYCPGKD